MKPIKIEQDQYVGSGAYARVYRISPRRVAKIYFHKPKYGLPAYINGTTDAIIDEIEGSQQDSKCLPVIKVIDVILPDCKRPVKAIIKRYIPNRCDINDYEKFYNNIDRRKPVFWDVHPENLRKDSKGKIWLIDTQTDLRRKSDEDY